MIVEAVAAEGDSNLLYYPFRLRLTGDNARA